MNRSFVAEQLRRTARWLLLPVISGLISCSGDPFSDQNAGSGPVVFAVSSTNPASGASDVPINKQIDATFTDNLDCAGVSSASFTVNHVNGAVAGTLNCAGNQFTFRPSGTLQPLTEHTATLMQGIPGQSGNVLAADFAWRFTTGVAPDTTPPAVSSTDPTAGATNVPPGKSISAVFSEALDCASVAGNFLVSGPGGNVAGSVTCAGEQVAFAPSVTLAPQSPHVALLKKAIRDTAGNSMVADYNWNFTTGDGPDLTPPTVISTDPGDNETGVSTSKKLTATFSEPVACGVDPDMALSLRDSGGATVPGKVTCSGNQVKFDPDGSLNGLFTSYTATLNATITDLAGNPIVPFSWSFSTGLL